MVKGGGTKEGIMEDDFDWGEKPKQKETEETKKEANQGKDQVKPREEEVEVKEGEEKIEEIGELDKLVEQMKQEKEVKKKEPRVIKQQEAADPLCWDDLDDWKVEEEGEDQKKKKIEASEKELQRSVKVTNAKGIVVKSEKKSEDQFQHHSQISIKLNEAQTLSNNAHERAKKGMTNTRNNCFMNVVLQCLLSCPSFFNLLGYLREKEKVPEDSLTARFIELYGYFDMTLNSMSTSTQLTTRNVRVEKIFTELLNDFNPYNEECDSQEFLCLILDRLSSELKYLKKKCSSEEQQKEEEDEWNEVGKDGKSRAVQRAAESLVSDSPIADIFGGVFKNEFTVKGTGHQTVTHESFFTISLDISGAYTMKEVFIDFFSKSEVDDYIDPQLQGSPTSAIHTILLDKLPPILIVHFKRFLFDKRTAKIHKECSVIDLKDILELPQSALSASCNDQNARYELFAVVDHKGKEVYKGHYTCFVKESKHFWNYFNDTQVSTLKNHDFTKRVMAYLMFYRKL